MEKLTGTTVTVAADGTETILVGQHRRVIVRSEPELSLEPAFTPTLAVTRLKSISSLIKPVILSDTFLVSFPVRRLTGKAVLTKALA